jgi:hypothetical protein
MYKPKYNKYRGRSRRNESGNGWKRFCVLGFILGFALMINAFYGAEIREFAQVRFGTRDYATAVSALGGAINGESTLSDAWGEAVAALSPSSNDFDGAVPVFTQPITANSASGNAAFDLIYRGGEFGLSDSGESAEAEDVLAEDAVLTFDYAVTAAARDEIAAYADGTVLATGDSEIYGNYVIMFCGNITVQYFNLNEILVESGQHVSKGDIIAKVTNTIGISAEDAPT